MGFETVYPVVDCPDHPQSALRMPSGRQFCFACGREVREPDGILMLDPWLSDADAELSTEARTAWNASRVIRDFAAACQPGTSPLTTKVAT